MFDICELDEDTPSTDATLSSSTSFVAPNTTLTAEQKRQQLKQKLQEKKLQRTAKTVLSYKLQQACNSKPKKNAPKQNNNVSN